jgi:uncharacterized membrane protein
MKSEIPANPYRAPQEPASSQARSDKRAGPFIGLAVACVSAALLVCGVLTVFYFALTPRDIYIHDPVFSPSAVVWIIGAIAGLVGVAGFLGWIWWRRR